MASRWTAEQRAEALELYEQVGQSEAARRTGIPRGTIGDWARNANLSTAVGAVTDRSDPQKATLAAGLKHASDLDASRDRRMTLLAAAAELSLTRTVNRLREANSTFSDRDLVGIWTRAHHDLQILTGAATENLAVQVVFNVPPPAPEPPQVHRQDDLPAIGA